MSRSRLLSTVMVCLCLAAAGSVRAEVEAFTRARHELRLAFTISGKVESVMVESGQKIEPGDVLIKLNDEEIAAQVDLWRLRAESEVGREVAEASLEMAKWEEARLRQVIESDAGSKLEYERAKIQIRIEESRVDQAEEQQKEAQKELGRYEAQLRRFTMKAPIAGQVERLIVSEGETVEQLQPVLVLVSTDPLWIDAPVPTEQTMDLEVGDPAWVRSDLPGYFNEPQEGRIIHIRQVADAASDTRLVRIELDNPHNKPAGVQVTVSFEPPSEMVRSDTDDAMPTNQTEPR